VLGTPICPDGYDYPGAVLWNALAPALATDDDLPAPRPGPGDRPDRRPGSRRRSGQLRQGGRVPGPRAVHLHAVIRLDGPDPYTPPPAWASAKLLAAGCRPAPDHRPGRPPESTGRPADPLGRPARPSPIHPGTGERPDGQVAGYLAKYATKATDGLGAALVQPITSAAQLERLGLPEHTARLVRACWTLGRQPATAELGLRRWAHMLGYGGHCLTKSRHYSTTMGALRAARRAFATRRHHGPTVPLDRDGRLLPPAGTIAVAGWQYAGRGYTTPADAWLAASMAADHQQARRLAREELSGVA
jgi:replication initiator protein RepSA